MLSSHLIHGLPLGRFPISYLSSLDMHPLAAASRSRLAEMVPNLFVFETSYYALSPAYILKI